MATLRAAQVLIPANTTLPAGAYTSPSVSLGAMVNVALYVTVGGAVTFTIQAGLDAGGIPGAGANQMPNAIWFDYLRSDSYDTAGGVEGNLAEIVFGGAGSVCIDQSPFAPTYLRLKTGTGGTVTASAYVVATG